MKTLIAYILQVNIALVIFYLLYILFLKKDTFFAFRRYYFLCAIVFSFAYPFVSVSALGNILSFEKQVKYPVIAQENNVQGLIHTSFNVDNNGKVSNIKIESGEDALLNKEALRVIGAMPQWTKDQSVLVTGKIANSDGNFQLTVPSKEGVLAVSYVGYKLSEIPIANLPSRSGNREVKLPFVFRLQGDNVEEYNGPTPHNAVVIVGYGNSK